MNPKIYERVLQQWAMRNFRWMRRGAAIIGAGLMAILSANATLGAFMLIAGILLCVPEPRPCSDPFWNS